MERLGALDVEMPEAVASLDWLTPWGVLFRYDSYPDALDRDQALEAATATVAMAERLVQE